MPVLLLLSGFSSIVALRKSYGAGNFGYSSLAFAAARKGRMNQLPERQQVQVEGIGNGCEGRAGRGEDDGAGDGPWNDGRDDDSCVFQVFRKLLLVLIERPAELGCKDDCERLAAGNEARDDGREQRRRIIPEAACKGFKFPMDAVQKSRPLENAGEGSGEADDGGDMEHGYDASPIDHGRKFRDGRNVAEDHDEKDIPWILRLLGVGKKRRQSDADGHIRFDGYAEEAEEENGNGRQRKDGRKDIELFKVCRSCG